MQYFALVEVTCDQAEFPLCFDGRGSSRANDSRPVPIGDDDRTGGRCTLNFHADAVKVLDNARLNGAYNGGLGNRNLVDSPAKGLMVGIGSSDWFGTLAPGHREVVTEVLTWE